MSEPKSYVRVDEHGVYRVGETRVMLDSVIAAFRQGDSPETIQQQYPALTLEDVYGSVAYCLANPAEIDAYFKRQDAEWAKARARAEAMRKRRRCAFTCPQEKPAWRRRHEPAAILGGMSNHG